MKLVLLFGSAAVGKMTVGQELTKITDLRLFHNHMTIEPVLEIFGYYKPDTIEKLRKIIFEDYANSSNYGLIFTFIWAFDCQEDWDNVKAITEIFSDADIYYVELTAPLETRLKRNKTKNRLANKPSKRNTGFSDTLILNDESKYRLISNDGEIQFENYMKNDNTNLKPDTVANIIKDKFQL